MKQLILKFREGDPLTDEELDKLIEHYIILESHLSEHGEILHLTWRFIYHELFTLGYYKSARQK